jgi:ADP-ribose pyrophosphatase
MDIHEKVIGNKILHQGKSYKFCLVEVELPNGQRLEREMVKHPGGVAVLAIDSENRCVMVEQYRYAIQETTKEIPAGKLDKIPGETPEQGGRRELEEETGISASSWFYLGKIHPSPGIMDEVLHLFLARDLRETSRQNLDDDEFINVYRVPLAELKAQIETGLINDCKTISALFLAELKKKL